MDKGGSNGTKTCSATWIAEGTGKGGKVYSTVVVCSVLWSVGKQRGKRESKNRMHQDPELTKQSWRQLKTQTST